MNGDDCPHCGGTGKNPVKICIVTTPGEESGFLTRMYAAACAAGEPRFEFVGWPEEGENPLLNMDYADLEARVSAQYSEPIDTRDALPEDTNKRKHRAKGRNRREW